jgi:hypothetical protein
MRKAPKSSAVKVIRKRVIESVDDLNETLSKQGNGLSRNGLPRVVRVIKKATRDMAFDYKLGA